MFMYEMKDRKATRLKGADYNQNQAVFLTICTKGRQCLLSQIVGTGVLAGPYGAKFHTFAVCINVQEVLQ